jgi:hypothetical protein
MSSGVLVTVDVRIWDHSEKSSWVVFWPLTGTRSSLLSEKDSAGGFNVLSTQLSS